MGLGVRQAQAHAPAPQLKTVRPLSGRERSSVYKSENLTGIRVVYYQPSVRIAPYSQKEENPMTRQEILDQISQTLGGVPGWLDGLPDSQLEHQWGLTAWFLSDSKLTARDKALVAFGAAAAGRCQY